MFIQTGPRAIPDTGPDLVGHRTADFAADLALPSPTVSALTLSISLFCVFHMIPSVLSRPQLVRRTSELSSMSASESPLFRGMLAAMYPATCNYREC